MTWLCSERVIRWTRMVLVAQLAAGAVYFLAVRPALAQGSDVLLERVSHMAERVAALEQMGIPARLAVVEDNLLEVKWLGRTVAAAVAGQLVLALFAQKRVR